MLLTVIKFSLLLCSIQNLDFDSTGERASVVIDVVDQHGNKVKYFSAHLRLTGSMELVRYVPGMQVATGDYEISVHADGFGPKRMTYRIDGNSERIVVPVRFGPNERVHALTFEFRSQRPTCQWLKLLPLFGDDVAKRDFRLFGSTVTISNVMPGAYVVVRLDDRGQPCSLNPIRINMQSKQILKLD
jgi:hypothetical protein